MKQIERQELESAVQDGSGRDFEERREALMTKLVHLGQLSDSLFQKTSFGLADQVLTHAMVSVELAFSLVSDADSGSALKRSIQDITLERYGLELSTEELSGGDFHVLSAEAGSSSLLAGNLLKGWSDDDLVRYVLDHEVPVNPEDMPGHARLAA